MALKRGPSGRARGRLSRGLLLSIFVAGALTAPLGGVGARAACVGAHAARPGWTSIPVPAFSSGGPLTAHVLDPRQPAIVLATDGAEVVRSTDGGCRWSDVWSVPASPSPAYPYAGSATIEAIAVPEAGMTSGVVLLMIDEDVGGTHRPHIVRSEDRGATWAPADAGLPPAGRPVAVALSSEPDPSAYLVVEVSPTARDLVYASDDAGRSWELRSDPGAGEGPSGTAGLVVDPVESEQLWAWGSSGLYRSEDAGTTFALVPELAGTGISAFDLWHDSGAVARVLAFSPDLGFIARSNDAGTTWLRVAAPGEVVSFAHGLFSDQIWASTGADVYAYSPSNFSWLPMRSPQGGLAELRARPTRSSVFFGRTDRSIEVFRGPPPRDPVTVIRDPLTNVPWLRVPEVGRNVPRLTPGRTRVVMPAGGSKRVPYALGLGGDGPPLDVFFLVDTSESMGGAINGLRSGLAGMINGLAAQGIDAHFGLGEYRAYPDRFPPALNEPNFVYRRVKDVGPVSGELAEALATLQPAAGGHFDAHLGALYQTATGAGQDVDPPGPLGNDVPPGQQANFRAKALRVVIHATDEPFGRNEPDRSDIDIPSFDEAISALDAKGIVQVGISVGSEPTSDLSRVAAATGAVAPSGGVDCSGDGIADVGAGAPLVCVVPRRELDQAERLVPAVVSLLAALRSEADVSLEVAPRSPLVDGVLPRVRHGVVLDRDRPLSFDVLFTCPRLTEATRDRVELRAVVHDRILDTASATIVCRPVEPATLIPPAAAFAGLVPLVPFAPPPPPLAHFAQTQAQAQSQAQAQAAAAMQEQENPQLAFVHAMQRAALGTEDLEMTAYRRPSGDDSPAPYALGSAALMMGIAFGWAMARERSRVVPATNRSRTGPR